MNIFTKAKDTDYNQLDIKRISKFQLYRQRDHFKNSFFSFSAQKPVEKNKELFQECLLT